MECFFSKKRRGESSSCSITPFIGANVEVEENVETETNFNEYVRDPGLRKPIDEFDIAIRDQVRREYWSMGPCQVVGHTYPKTEFGTQLKSFQDAWYEKFVWLEYSVSKDACFCFWCYLFKAHDQNIVQAMILIDAVKSQLHDFRNTGWEIICDEVNRFCEVNAISLIDMEDTITRPGYRRQSITNDHYYRVEIFTEVVDLIIQEMNNRFSEASTDLLRCMACLDPRDSFSQFDINQLMRFTTWYPEDFSAGDYLLFFTIIS
ncbi:uncharacterized protein LOC131009879 [Salvia miltiorrhiza]|uniref:uncharacterized protein LOC131009879 n=1 Tax=Salvia miltiorrhiza TaxID=226208 RepID=UPI0025ABD5F5|nr:uncharacterized protein LOC131009879 [Salvia miltiorrhiza]